MPVANREYARRVERALARSIADVPATVTLVDLASLLGRAIYILEVAIAEGPTLTFAPDAIEDGAEGILDDVLVEIRRAAGEEIAYRPRPSTIRPGKYFTDIIATTPEDPDADA